MLSVIIISCLVLICSVAFGVHWITKKAEKEHEANRVLAANYAQTPVRPNDLGGWGILIGSNIVGDYATPEEALAVIRGFEVIPLRPKKPLWPRDPVHQRASEYDRK